MERREDARDCKVFILVYFVSADTRLASPNVSTPSPFLPLSSLPVFSNETRRTSSGILQRYSRREFYISALVIRANSFIFDATRFSPLYLANANLPIARERTSRRESRRRNRRMDRWMQVISVKNHIFFFFFR